jgi:hypothetical protein
LARPADGKDQKDSRVTRTKHALPTFLRLNRRKPGTKHAITPLSYSSRPTSISADAVNKRRLTQPDVNFWDGISKGWEVALYAAPSPV